MGIKLCLFVFAVCCVCSSNSPFASWNDLQFTLYLLCQPISEAASSSCLGSERNPKEVWLNILFPFHQSQRTQSARKKAGEEVGEDRKRKMRPHSLTLPYQYYQQQQQSSITSRKLLFISSILCFIYLLTPPHSRCK